MTQRLVILGSTITALAVARDAHAHGLRAIVFDTEPGIACRSRHVEAVIARGTGEEVLALQVGALGGADAHLIATGDAWLRIVRRHWQEFAERYERILHPGADALDVCLSKATFSVWCREHGLSAPLAWLVDVEPRPAELHLPLMLRPASTLHDQRDAGLPKAVQVATEAELDQWITRFRERQCPLLATESLLGEPLTQFSVPVARAGGRTISFVARKVRPLPEACSVGTCVELMPDTEIETLGRRAIELLDYYGVGEVEILRAHDRGRDYLIEINARPWLQYQLAPASGHDFLGLLLDPVLSERHSARKIGYTWIDFSADLYASFSRTEGAVRAQGMSLRTYLASVARANVFARFAWSDPMPAFDVLMLGPRGRGLRHPDAPAHTSE